MSNTIQWETREILPAENGKMVEERTGFHKFTGEDVSERREVDWDGPPLQYVGRAAGDDARWEEVKAIKKEQVENAEPKPLPDITRALHDHAEQVIHAANGRRTFGGLGGILTKKKEA